MIAIRLIIKLNIKFLLELKIKETKCCIVSVISDGPSCSYTCIQCDRKVTQLKSKKYY